MHLFICVLSHPEIYWPKENCQGFICVNCSFFPFSKVAQQNSVNCYLILFLYPFAACSFHLYFWKVLLQDNRFLSWLWFRFSRNYIVSSVKKEPLLLVSHSTEGVQQEKESNFNYHHTKVLTWMSGKLFWLFIKSVSKQLLDFSHSIREIHKICCIRDPALADTKAQRVPPEYDKKLPF